MAREKTIAFVSDAIYPYNKGGKETRLYEISTRLAQRGYNVHIYCMKWWKGEEKERFENGVHLHAICPYIPLYDGPRRSIKQGILFGLACLKLITAKFDVIDVDHMPFFPIYAVRLVCWLRVKKMIGTWNEVWGAQYWDKYLQGVKAKIAALIEKGAIILPDTIISISPLTTSRLVHDFRVSETKIISLACGYNSEIIAEAPASREKSDVIFVGRLLSHKNVDVLLNAVARVKKVKPKILCRIIGTGPEEANLKTLCSKLKLDKNVIFHGHLSDHREVYSFMKSSKVFVLPSSREGFGIVVLEANACGLPVITANDPNNAAVLLAQDVAPLLPLEFSKYIKKYVMQSKVIITNIKKHKQYNWASIATNYEKLILT